MARRRVGLGCWLVLLASALCAGPPVEELERRLRSARGKERLAILTELADLAGETDPARELALAQEALTLAEAEKDAAAEAGARYHIGKAKAFLGEAEVALEPLQQSAALYERLGDRKGVGDATNALGIAEYRLGRFDSALGRFEKALAIWEETGNKKNAATLLANIGTIHCQRSRWQEGLLYFQRSLEAQRQVANPKGEALALNNIGIVYQHLGRYADAVDVYLRALKIEEALDNRTGIARACGNLGIIYKNLKQWDSALEFMKRGLALNRELGDRHSEAMDLNNIGGVYADQGDLKTALSYYEQAMVIREAMKDPGGLSSTLINFGEAHHKLGEHERARREFERALSLAEGAGLKGDMIPALRHLAAVQKDLGDVAGAARSLDRGLRLVEEGADRELERDIHEGLSELEAARGDFKSAYRHRRRYDELQDAIVQQQSNDKIAELRAKYDAEKRQQEIELLRRDNEIQRLRLRSERLKINLLVAGMALLALLLVVFFRKYRHLLAFWKRKSYVGHYRIIERIGAGGMGEVYKAAHIRDESKKVAVKVLREAFTDDPLLRQRFKNEAVIIDQLNDPHIVRVFERGEYNQRLYIAMELLDGKSLAALIRGGQRPPLQDCVFIMSQLAETVARLHSKGIVHRDLQPENVMLVDGVDTKHFVKLLDFDIAKSHSLTRMTETGVILGTVGYLAPEQITTQTSSPASDVYSLGVVFYELVTVEKPFLGEMAMDVVRQILEKEPLAPAQLRPDTPPDVSALILEMLSKDPDRRPTDEALVERLERLAMPLH